jgi:hypothetical protein
MEETQKKHRIGKLSAVILVVVAIIADLITLIPIAGDIVGPIFWVFAGLYFWKSGLGFVNGKRLVTGAISLVAELIPGIQEFPTIALGMIIIVIMTRFEEKTGISITSLAGGGTKAPLVHGGTRIPSMTTSPLNQGGVRSPNGGLMRK